MGSMPATAVSPSSSGGSGGFTSVMSGVACSDVEESHVGGVGGDEVLAQLDVVAHQHRHDLVGERSLLDVDLQQRALRGVHGGGPELLPIHLAQALQAGELETLGGVLGEERLTRPL